MSAENLSKLPDSKTYINRLRVESSDSGNPHIIAQRRTDMVWCCDCWPWRKNRTCDHLKSLGLEGSRKPVDEVIDLIGRMRFNAQQIRATAGASARPAPKAKPAPKPTPLRSVDLIAVAFEWECFSCCHANREEEVGAEVACANCNARFKVGKFRRAR